MLLTRDINPERVKNLTLTEKSALCDEIRKLLTSVVPRNGGHLASNLGTVELIVAMHSVFSTPLDKFIFDVGHQAYTHKILTGRLAEFESLRQEDGISGFPRPSESEHDAFIGGHASISVSAGLGIAAAKKLKGEDGNVVVVAGDGAFTGGEIYEGLNNADKTAGNLIVILNDNQMCISKSSGAIAAYLSQIRTQIRTKTYYETKSRAKKALHKTALGKKASNAIGETKRLIKGALISDNLFENLGLKYFGPADGHNLDELIDILELVKTIDEPCLIHVKTKKGKGFIPAEENAGQYHGVESSRLAVRSLAKSQTYSPTYSEVFGREIARLGSEDKKICLITAAMKYATGCNYFAKRFPERFFDTGIAEAHAATFAAGLASGGFLPVFAVYSTFLQRSFDQLLHDAAIENLRIVLAIDRAGLCGEDGATHQGIFDVGLISMLPGAKIYSPLTAEELRLCLNRAIYNDSGVSAVRYPRGAVIEDIADEETTNFDYKLYKSKGNNKAKKLIITYGRIAKNALSLVESGDNNADVLRLVQINPLSDEVCGVIGGYDDIIFFEEGSLKGGVAERTAAMLAGMGVKPNFKARGIEGFIDHADLERQQKHCGLDVRGVREFAGL